VIFDTTGKPTSTSRNNVEPPTKRERDPPRRTVRTNPVRQKASICFTEKPIFPTTTRRTTYYSTTPSPSFLEAARLPSTTRAPTMELEPSPNALSLERGAAHFRQSLLATTDIRSNTPEENTTDGIVPATSQVLAEATYNFNLRTKTGKEAMIASLPTDVQTKLQQPFGKDDIDHSFTNSVTLMHTFLPLHFSDFLDDSDWKRLYTTCTFAREFQTLLADYGSVDFTPLRTNFFREGWQDATDFDHDRSDMLTACVLFYRGDTASVVRYVGGPLVGDHRNWDDILNSIRGIVDNVTYNNIERIFKTGCPARCNATSSTRNLWDYLEYGNHSSATNNDAILHKTLLKDEKRGHTIMLDPRLIPFIQHLHVCPVGLVDLNHPIKSPRFIYDASFKPNPWNETVNTWTTKTTEPDLEFPQSFQRLLVWLWNMRISYPDEEIYPLDDDVTAAFRSLSWHPNMVSMHGMVVLDKLWLNCRLTFGDTTSPPNFEPVAIARRELAKHFYNLPNVEELAAKYIPNLDILLPSKADILSIMRIPPDSLNPGVQSTGSRAAHTPPYVMHVDDNLYGALRKYLRRAIAASILALYHIAGFPVATQPDPFSYEKFDLTICNIRKLIGTMIDTRSMFLWLPDYKRLLIVALLAEWLEKDYFTIHEALVLQGTLMDASRFYRWGRINFFILSAVIRKAMSQKYEILRRGWAEERKKYWENKIANTALPTSQQKLLVAHCCDRDYARYMYFSNDRTRIGVRLNAEVQLFHDYMKDPANPWRINIGHMIPRDPVTVNIGDSSFYGVGFFSDELHTFCMIPTDSAIRRRCNLNSRHDEYLSQNVMEYITGVIDFAFSITFLEHLSCEEDRQRFFPNGVPPYPQTLSRKDNVTAEKWINAAASDSIQAQQLIRITGEMGKSTKVHQAANHIDGDDNDEADMLSRPDKPDYRLDPDSLSAHLDATLAKYARFQQYKVFLPSSNLMDALHWALRPKSKIGKTEITPPQLAQPYGRLVTIEEFRVSMVFLH